jgi:hypothetical protein
MRIGALVFVVLFLLVFIGPALLIWSINTLFGLAIAMTFKNWFAALLIMCLLRGNSSSSKS